MKGFSVETFLNELEVLVNIDSGYGAPDGATQVGLLLAEPLVAQGWLMERHRPSQEYGEVIVLKNREAEKYDVLMIGHTDTVFPAGETIRRPFTRDDKRAYGVGVLDMKQGCLAMSHVLKNLPKDVLDKLNIAVVFNPDEETGSPASKDITDEIARRCEYGMVFEAASTAGPRCILRKGMMRLTVEFHGKAGHSGYAFENGGISAVNEMAYWITELVKLHRAETGTSINAGVARGGQAVNIIPDFAELQLDIRYEQMDEMAKIEAVLAALEDHARAAGLRLVEKKRSKTPPMEPTAKTMELCELAKEVSTTLGQTFTTKKRGGLSDGNHIAACGCTTIDGLGPTGDFDHSEDEYLELSTIEPNIDFAYGLLCKLAEKKQEREDTMYNYFFKDPPHDVLVPPESEGLVINSHGSKIFGRLLLPAFTDLESNCPVVLMLHGCPGIEQNLDIAQHLRMAGFAVVHFCYRGVWGSHGYYRFSHLIEDTLAVAAYIREQAGKWRIDPERLYVFGHSMGGFAAVNSMAAGLKVKGAVIMAPCDMASKYLYDKAAFDKLTISQDQGYFNTPSRDYIENEFKERAEEWLFVNVAKRLDNTIPYRFIGGTLDTATPPQVHIKPILDVLIEHECDVQYTEFRDGHTFPASRVRLTEQIISYLNKMEERT